MTGWMEAIQNVRQKRLEEARFMQSGCDSADKTNHITKEHLMALAEAIGKLSVAIKRVRTGLWCTLQFTIAAVDKANQKDKSTWKYFEFQERRSSTFTYANIILLHYYKIPASNS